MTIRKDKDANGNVVGYRMTLSARDTYDWSRRPGAAWPCSTLADNRCAVSVDKNGLYDFSLNGRDGDCDGNELDAIVADHLPTDCRHLWPCWN